MGLIWGWRTQGSLERFRASALWPFVPKGRSLDDSNRIVVVDPIEGVDDGVEVLHRHSYVADSTLKEAAITVPFQRSLLHDPAPHRFNPINGVGMPRMRRAHNESKKLTYYASPDRHKELYRIFELQGATVLWQSRLRFVTLKLCR